MHPNDAFIAYKRAGLDGERAEREMAYEPDIYGELDQRLGLTEPGAPTVQDRSADIEREVRVWNEFWNFVLGGVVMDGDGVGLRVIAQRFVALVFHFAPHLLREPQPGEIRRSKKTKRPPGSVISLAALARQPLLDCKPEVLRKIARQFIAKVEQLS